MCHSGGSWRSWSAMWCLTGSYDAALDTFSVNEWRMCAIPFKPVITQEFAADLRIRSQCPMAI